MSRPRERYGPWVIDAPLAKGGMATVYLCHHEDRPEEILAIKLVRASASMERFLREGEILYALHHPAIVHVVEVGMDVDNPYIVMEYAKGETLEQRLQRSALGMAEVCAVFQGLASALYHAHEIGVRHRDVKPANIILCADGSTRLLDFGIATLEGSSALTTPGRAMGTTRYMPPEILYTRNPDGALWDVYSLGVSLFEALRAEAAFHEQEAQESPLRWVALLQAKQALPPLDPGEDFPDSIRDLVRRSTHPDPNYRLSGMASFLAVLAWHQRVMREGVSATMPPTLNPPRAEPTLEIPAEPPTGIATWFRRILDWLGATR